MLRLWRSPLRLPWCRRCSTETKARPLAWQLREAFTRAARQAFPTLPHDWQAGIAVSASRFASDFQCNDALALARELRQKPADIAQQLLQSLPASASVFRCTVSGPGFINIVIPDDMLAHSVNALRHSNAAFEVPDGLFRSGARQPRVLVDFTSPNLSKELHVGHLRSAVIGDTLCRVMEFAGAHVARISHAGDWGLPVGLVMAQMLEERGSAAVLAALEAGGSLPHAAELSALYVAAKRRKDEDQAFKARVDDCVRALQQLHVRVIEAGMWPTLGAQQRGGSAQQRGGSACGYEPELAEQEASTWRDGACAGPPDSSLATRVADWLRASGDVEGAELWAAWWVVCEGARRDSNALFAQLDVRAEERGESCYAALAPKVLQALEQRGMLARDSAALVWLDDESVTDRRPPVVVQKSNGGYLYATTDLAALRHRVASGYDLVLYVTDASQQQHFQALFEVAKRAGWLDDARTRVHHVPFGLVTYSDGKKISSRGGTDLTLASLLQRGVEAVQQLLEAHRTSGSDGDTAVANAAVADVTDWMHRDSAAQLLPRAAGSLRYFDLRHTRTHNYAVSFPDMLALQGNTATYLMYSRARLQALRSKAEEAQRLGWGEALQAQHLVTDGQPPQLSAELELERKILLRLARFPDAVTDVLAHFEPHVLCDYLFGLAQELNAFYRACRVLGHERERQRLQLCAAADCVLARGMRLVGVKPLERV